MILPLSKVFLLLWSGSFPCLLDVRRRRCHLFPDSLASAKFLGLWDGSMNATRTDRRSSHQSSLQIEACRSAGPIAGLGVVTRGFLPGPALPARHRTIWRSINRREDRLYRRWGRLVSPQSLSKLDGLT